ncbi:PfkB family carbohydrate kinase [Nakamurella sp.]|uniref:PfkB family carbohydrate kinase n=1 Tax=Nakamurella sp. TaxID=1869182 RepID=UPI003B3B5A8D
MARPRGVFVGLTTVDLIHRVARPVGADEKVTALSQEIVAGGPAANAAVTFALLGGEAELITDLGRHPLARLAAQDLTANGVRVRAVVPDTDEPPAVSSIRVLDATGERSVVSVNAAARAVPAPDWLAAVLNGAAVLLLDGHHPRPALAAARAARERSVPVVLDAGSWKPVLDELLPLVDVAICSAAFRLPDGAVPPALLGRGVRRVAVTDGPQPVRWWAAGGERSGEGTVPIPRVVVRDTLGAGDVFHGAFAHQLAGRPGRSFADQLARSGSVAADRCQVVGMAAWRAWRQQMSTA